VKDSEVHYGYTWDVDYLKENGWKIIINSQEEISELLQIHKNESSNHLSQFEDFKPNTLIFWKGLYKFENYIHS
jgi:hypothetical protein